MIRAAAREDFGRRLSLDYDRPLAVRKRMLEDRLRADAVWRNQALRGHDLPPRQDGVEALATATAA